MNVPPPAHPPERLLLGPGPSPVHPEVLAAQARPLTGHLDPWFIGLMDEVADMLRDVLRTSNRITFPVSGTGSAGMQTAVANLLSPDDTVVVGVNGVFGGRFADAARRVGATVVELEEDWGRIIDPERVEEALRDHPDARAVMVVHAETSTGAHQPLAEIGRLVADTPALFVVDAVTSIAGVPLEVDAWHVDAVYAGTQKCLSVPPGLAPVSFSDKAVDVLTARSAAVPSWYFDVSAIREYWTGTSGGARAYHHTAPISAILGLHEGLRHVLEEGLDARWKRHDAVGGAFQEAIVTRGGTLLAQEGHRLPQLTAFAWPDGVDEGALRRRLLDEHGIEVGGGLGSFAGRAWRVGLMGEGARHEHVDRLLAAIDGFDTSA